jgi:LPXTG-motif cell wall-anchored protein
MVALPDAPVAEQRLDVLAEPAPEVSLPELELSTPAQSDPPRSIVAQAAPRRPATPDLRRVTAIPSTGEPDSLPVAAGLLAMAVAGLALRRLGTQRS